MENVPQDKAIILFDGVCNFCNHWVNFIIKHDKQDKFRFVSLQSDLGKKLKQHIGFQENIDSIVYYEPNFAYFIKSAAAFEIIKKLNYFPSKLLLLFRILPNYVTDFFYDYIAKNRYKWFGKSESCLIPTDAIKKKFLN